MALRAQGFSTPAPSRPQARHLQSAVRGMSLLQLDFVNVLIPAHYLVLYARLGSYRRELVDRALYPAGFTEAWAHEACLVPVESWPLLYHRRATHRVRPWGFEKFLQQHAAFAESVLEQVRERGPLAAEDIETPAHVPAKIENSWYSSSARGVLEAYFGQGLLAVRGRRANFARVYDLAERLIQPDLLHRCVPEGEARRELLLQAGAALGVATAADLADYFRMYVTDAKPVIEELVSDGLLEPVNVEGWRQQAYLHPEARPTRRNPTTLLSPFDPLIFYRPRTLRLFGFDYRLEIFVPAAQRRWGYYVLPFLYEGRLAARVDLKADRANQRLVALATHFEANVGRAAVREALEAELARLGGWLGLAHGDG